jgi:hypothetical protein
MPGRIPGRLAVNERQFAGRAAAIPAHAVM